MLGLVGDVRSVRAIGIYRRGVDDASAGSSCGVPEPMPIADYVGLRSPVHVVPSAGGDTVDRRPGGVALGPRHAVDARVIRQ
jgi:hypothetical protein